MLEVRVKSFIDLHKCFSQYRNNNLWLFRGQSDPTWKLVPKAGRLPYSKVDDKNNFMSWKRRSLEYMESIPSSDWDWIAIAQHHGLATRILDWTFNPLTAAYFSVRDNSGTDTVIYAFCCKTEILTDKISAFDYKGIGKFKPNGVSQRIVRQSGIFTIHNPPTLCLDDNTKNGNELNKIIIDSSYVRDLQFELSYYGINSLSMFPDLEGLSSHINWCTENIDYWSGKSIDDLE